MTTKREAVRISVTELLLTNHRDQEQVRLNLPPLPLEEVALPLRASVAVLDLHTLGVADRSYPPSRGEIWRVPDNLRLASKEFEVIGKIGFSPMSRFRSFRLLKSFYEPPLRRPRTQSLGVMRSLNFWSSCALCLCGTIHSFANCRLRS